jgi:putative ABC transport system permease protein
MLRLSLRSVWGHKRRLAATVAAVLLGVAFLSGTLVLGETLNATFDDLVEDATAGDVIVRDPTTLTGVRPGDVEQTALIDGTLLDEVGAVDGVASAAPYIEGRAALVDQDGEQVGGPGADRIGANWVDDPALNPYRLAEGRGPVSDDEVVLNVGAADTADLQVGDRATIQVPAPLEVTVVGLATFGEEDGLGDTTFAAFTLDAAQRHFAGDQDRLSSVLVAADSGVSQDELAGRIAPSLPSGLEAITGNELTDENLEEVDAFIGPMRTLMVGFAAIALFMATFGIHNTFSIVVAQRTREIGLLRSVGAERRQVMVGIVLEALAVGLLASAAGTMGGLAVAMLLIGLLEGFGFALPAGGLTITGTTLVLPLVAGVLATLGAAVLPARRAARTSPMAALRDAALDRTDSSRRRAVLGAAVLAAGAITVVAGVTTGGHSMADEGGGRLLNSLGSVSIALVGALICLIGVVVIGPVVAGRAVGLLGLPLARLRGIGGSMARRNAMRNPRRTSATASALLVGVSVVVLFTVLAASLSAALDDSVDRSFGGDLVSAAPIVGGTGIDREMAPAIGEADEVATAVGIGAAAARVDGEERGLSYADLDALDQVFDLDVLEGSLRDLGNDELAVASGTAEDNGWELGSTVAVEYPDGTHESFTVGALYEDANIVASVLMPRAAVVPHVVQPVDTAVFVDLVDGVDVTAAKATLDPIVSTFGGPDLADRDEYAGDLAEGLNTMLGIVYALLALTVVIALLGIANTVSLSIHERRRELGILRAVGQTRRQLKRMVRDESVLISMVGTVGGLGLGGVLAWALVEAISASSNVVSFSLPLALLLVILLVASHAGALAGIRPARRAARTGMLQGIQSE